MTVASPRQSHPDEYDDWFDPIPVYDIGAIYDLDSTKPRKGQRPIKARPIGFVHFPEPRGRRPKRRDIGFLPRTEDA